MLTNSLSYYKIQTEIIGLPFMRYNRKAPGMKKKRKNATLLTQIYLNDIFLFNESQGFYVWTKLNTNFVAIQ